MERISNLFGARTPLPKKTRTTERGELLETFLSRLNPGRKAKGYPLLTAGRLAFLLTGIPTKDLYALLSKMNDAERRNVPASAVFWLEVKPPKSK